jgi:hypothetical protein
MRARGPARHAWSGQLPRMIGALAAGKATAWRKVRQAKDMPRQVIMARVGIHHRLLLRTDERAARAGDAPERGRCPRASMSHIYFTAAPQAVDIVMIPVNIQ